MIKDLTELDKLSTGLTGTALVRHHLQRADLLEQIIGVVKPQERDPWIRQVADSLSTAAQASPSGETIAASRLASLEKQLVQYMPGNNLTGYVVFRSLQADYNNKLSSGKTDAGKVQQEWVEKLTRFVQTYPKADDSADAMIQLGMAYEFLGKDVEAKNSYLRLAREFAEKPQGAEAQGAALRLDLEGKPFQLAGPTLADPNAAFDISQLSGKVVIVYYWASWNGQAVSDFAKLKSVLDANGKSVDLLCINLDNKPEEATAFLSKTPAPGTHLYQADGLDGKMATQYGVFALPSLFIVGKDGKCLSRNAQIGTIDEEVKKHVGK